MIFLQTSLLIGYVRITVKNFCPPCAGLILFDIPWILKFRTVVSKYDGEVLFKRSYSYGIAELVDGIDHTFLCTVRKQYEDHERAASEEQGKQTFAFIPAAFNSIHFNDFKLRKSLCIFFKVDVGSFVAVHLLDVPGSGFCTLFALLITNPPRQVNVPCGENSLIEIIIEGPPADRDLIAMNGKDVA